MDWFVNVNEPLEKLLLAHMKSGGCLCVVDDQKLVGIITQGDIFRFDFSSHTSVTAGDLCNKTFTKFSIENLEADYKEFTKNRNANIKKIPVVDKENNLLVLLDINSFGLVQSWDDAQKYEIDFWDKTENGRNFIVNRMKMVKEFTHEKPNKNNIVSEFIYSRNFFSNNPDIEPLILNHIEEKHVLEIGCGPILGFLPYLPTAKYRMAIEPLIDSYKKFWLESGLKMDDFVDKTYPIGADTFVPELANTVDGVIICLNALDHTPNWSFVLSNISSYATCGCYLYLWTDILHAGCPNAGHYNITPDANNVIRMVENFGFKIIETAANKPLQRNNLFVEIVAQKI